MFFGDLVVLSRSSHCPHCALSAPTLRCSSATSLRFPACCIVHVVHILFFSSSLVMVFFSLFLLFLLFSLFTSLFMFLFLFSHCSWLPSCVLFSRRFFCRVFLVAVSSRVRG
ncbi:hypothetical protein EV426DRAFT_629811 [Tirmania nivea]|nr:hypothetical protein EV426DRAFT_629811 [Tirmania nivea]